MKCTACLLFLLFWLVWGYARTTCNTLAWFLKLNLSWISQHRVSKLETSTLIQSHVQTLQICSECVSQQRSWQRHNQQAIFVIARQEVSLCQPSWKWPPSSIFKKVNVCFLSSYGNWLAVNRLKSGKVSLLCKISFCDLPSMWNLQ